MPIGYYDPAFDPDGGPLVIGAPITYGGCRWSAWGGQPLNNGKNCIQQPDGRVQCWAYLRSAGEEVGECTECKEGTPVEEPQDMGQPETGTQTVTNPATGETTTTNTETKRQVHPDGSTTETTTKTTTTTSGSGTTTTVETTTVNVSSNGVTTTTTQTDVTGPDGITHTTISGTSQTGKGPQEEGEGQGGNCDPTREDYLQCVQLVEEIADGKADELTTGLDDAGTAALDQWESDTESLIDAEFVVERPSVIESMVAEFIPSPVGCTDLSMSYNGHTMTLSCSKLEPLRQWLGWLFAVGAALTVFYIALRPQTT